MFTKVPFAFVLALLFFNACKKSRDNPPPTPNGFTVDGIFFNTTHMFHNTATRSDVIINSTDNEGGSLVCSTSEPIPTTDGNYTYQLNGSAGAINSMNFRYFDNSLPTYYTLSGASGKTAVVTVNGSKLSISFPTVGLDAFSGTGHKDISATSSE